MRKKILLWIMDTRIYKFVLKKIAPYIRFSMGYSKMRGINYHEGYRHVRPGIMAGTIDYSKLTGIMIPKVTGGILAHCGICFNKRTGTQAETDWTVRFNGKEVYRAGLEMAEMTHNDFTLSDFYDMCKEADRVILFSCDDWDAEYVTELNKRVLYLHDSVYDIKFGFGIEALYCSELIYHADKLANGGEPRIQCDVSDLMGLGQKYISPDGLLCAKNVRVVWDSKRELDGLTGPEVEKLIFKGRSK